MSKNLILILAHHIIFLLGIYVYGFNPYWAIGLTLLSFLWVHITAGIMHHHFAHKEYKDNIINYILTFILMFTSLGSVLSFVASHRQHHAFCDTEKDPHSPTHIGKFNVYFLRWKPQRISPKLFKDIVTSKFQQFMHKYLLIFQISSVVILAMIDPVIVCFGLSLIVIITFHAAGMTNVLGHLNGEPRNSPELILTHGSAWRHGDHHAN